MVLESSQWYPESQRLAHSYGPQRKPQILKAFTELVCSVEGLQSQNGQLHYLSAPLHHGRTRALGRSSLVPLLMLSGTQNQIFPPAELQVCVLV